MKPNLLPLLAVILIGCGDSPTPPGEAGSTATGQPPIRVTAGPPPRKLLVRTIDLPGRAEAFERAPLYAKVSGYVAEIPVDIGDRIEGPRGDQPGAVLCRLDVPELQEELTQKRAMVAQAEAEIRQAEAGVKLAAAAARSARAKVNEAQAAIAREEAIYLRWQSEYERVLQLAEQGVVTMKVAAETKAEYDAADAGRKGAAARVAAVIATAEETEAGLEKATADAAAITARAAVADAEVRRLMTLFDYATIRAPFDGVVVERHVHTGHLVTTGGQGQAPLLVVMRADPIRVMVDVPEADAAWIGPRTKVEIRLPGGASPPYVGTVTRTGWALHETARTLLAEIDVPNADDRWRPGQYLQVKLTVAEREDAIVLPKTALVMQDKQTFCHVVQADKTVARRPIALGINTGTEFEVVSGLTGDEVVILLNANAFREGQTVEVAAPAK